ncbi:MAG: UDP-N-acetylglucosamine--N-acetylmuramyl-(pentapeptide) pyrophosphoryl-undecaprenol N-acetylglucosamine transferase [Clostridia bacterium]|nr:UDP-N-acetylglucosamine--N-acetylmuramyl-(pentapeptide) pyrophosphoryl-undecaprenol N-acetylglucosamine transferase [Clostridia bacterium]
MSKIILTGGGTAGHVTPNLALVDELKKRFDEVHYIGSREGIERNLVEKRGDIFYHPVTTVKLIRSFSLKNFTIPYKLLKGISECKKLIKQINPSVIFSKGGFVGLPVCLGAGKVPVILHESDRTVGLANRLCMKNCAMRLCSFPLDGGFTQVGAPLRRELYFGDKERARRQCGLRENLPFLLITGGSLGAKAINDAVESAKEKLTQKFNVVHISGTGECVRERRYFRTPYAENIADFMALCNFAVSRGGANTLFELIALNKPTIVIPLPKGNSRGDQIDNARYFEKKGCVKVLLQENLTTDSLLDSLEDLTHDENALIRNMSTQKNIDGRQKIIEILSKYAK